MVNNPLLGPYFLGVIGSVGIGGVPLDSHVSYRMSWSTMRTISKLFSPRFENRGRERWFGSIIFLGKITYLPIGGSFKYVLNMNPSLQEMIQFDQNFSDGLKPPTSWWCSNSFHVHGNTFGDFRFGGGVFNLLLMAFDGSYDTNMKIKFSWGHTRKETNDSVDISRTWMWCFRSPCWFTHGLPLPFFPKRCNFPVASLTSRRCLTRFQRSRLWPLRLHSKDPVLA